MRPKTFSSGSKSKTILMDFKCPTLYQKCTKVAQDSIVNLQLHNCMCEGCRGYIFLMFLLLRLKVHVCFDRRLDVSSRSCHTSPQLTGVAELKRLRVFCIVASFYSRPVIWVAVRVIFNNRASKNVLYFWWVKFCFNVWYFSRWCTQGGVKSETNMKCFFLQALCVLVKKGGKNHSSSSQNELSLTSFSQRHR